MFCIFLCSVPWFLFLPFALSPLRQIQLILCVLLSSMLLLREAGSWAAQGWVFSGHRVWLLMPHHHWKQFPEWLLASAPDCMRTCVVLLRHLHSHPAFLFSLTFTLKKLLLTLSHFHKLTIFLLCFHRLRQRASIGKSASFIHHFQVLSRAENSNSASHTCCCRAPDFFK